MKPLLLVILVPVSLLGLLIWPGGGQRCNTCQLGREVRVFASVEVPIWISSSECSRWVSRNMPGHEHQWKRVGCWSMLSGIGCYFGGRSFGIHAERWFRALQAAEPAERAVLMELANRATFDEDRQPAWEELERRVSKLVPDAEVSGADLSPRRER